MKLLRIGVVVAALVLLVLGISCLFVYLNQERIIAYVLSNVREDSGIRIEAPASHLEIRDHLIVVLDNPRVSLPTGETVTLDRIRAVVNYHAILFTNGLPIRDLVFENPKVRLLSRVSDFGAALVYPKPEMVRKAVLDIERLARIARRLDVVGLSLSDASGQSLLDHVGLTAFRTRRAPRLWNVRMDGTVASGSLGGARLAARFRAGAGAPIPAHVLAKGRLWFWKLPIEGLSIRGFKVSTAVHGSSGFELYDDASVDGNATIGATALTVAGTELKKPLALGSYTLEAQFVTSPDQIAVTGATLRHGSRALLSAQGKLERPASPTPTVKIEISGLGFDWDDMLPILRSLRAPPHGLELVMQHLRRAKLTIAGASLKAPLAVLTHPAEKPLLDSLVVSAQLVGADFTLPAASRLPPVSAMSAQLNCSGGLMSVTQGAAKIGKSSIHGLESKLDLRRDLSRVPYNVEFTAQADLGELKPAVTVAAEHFKVGGIQRLEDLSGAARIHARASGVLGGPGPGTLESYEVRVEPQGSKILVRGAPAPLTVTSGIAVLTPAAIDLQKIVIQTDGGEVDVNGQVRLVGGEVATSGLTVDIHQLPTREWLALAVAPGDLSAKGLVGGQVVLTRAPGTAMKLDGKLTVGPGQVHFGFLRAPIVDRVAIVTLHGRGLTLSIPDSRLQDQPLNIQVSVADWRHPKLRMKAVVRRLDFRVLSFFRLPWEPPTRVYKMKIPASGHLEAASAMFGKLPLSDMKGDFTYDAGNWRVYNFSAKSLKGQMRLEISGRARDNWIHMVGKVRGMEVGPLMLLSGQRTESPLLGRLKVDADLKADTNGDFFDTLSGNASITVRDGKLNRFTLLSRLLSFINLKNWLTANVPNPLEVGVPFETVTADFNGSQGVFHTDNLRLHGPVMDIVASGSVNVANSHLDMVIGMLPFKTVNWILSNIPLIGKNVAGGTKGLLAAYFRVTGQASDPSVTPAPITSVEELVKRTLGLPINILVPNTIK